MAYFERTQPTQRFPRGGWKVTYRGPDGREHSKTMATKAAAAKWLHEEQEKRRRGAWVDPRAGRITFGDWWARWFEAAELRRTTRSLYQYLARSFLLPEFGSVPLASISPTQVREWNAKLRKREGLSPSTVAKAYRLLSVVMKTAVRDELITSSPCKIERAGTEDTPEMQVASVEQVHALADAAGEQHRAIVLTAAFAGLRWGELAGLRRRSVDLLHRTITVREQVTEVDGRIEFGPPKTESGRRTVALPGFLVDELERHLSMWAERGPDGLVFPAPEGGPMRRSNFNRRVWQPARKAAGVDGLRFHDLRHTAGTLAAQAGATTAELMARLGHKSHHAALIYQHATSERDAQLAQRLENLAAWPRPGASEEPEAVVVALSQ